MHSKSHLGQPDALTPSKDSNRIERRAAIASVIGTTIEWYDFFIYGTAAALIFPKLFFAHGSSEGLMESFATIFVGFLSRPLGGAIFGYMGDRVGRKSTLVATLTLDGRGNLVRRSSADGPADWPHRRLASHCPSVPARNWRGRGMGRCCSALNGEPSRQAPWLHGIVAERGCASRAGDLRSRLELV